MSTNVTPQLALAVRAHLAIHKVESTSFLHRTLREDGWRHLGNLYNFRRALVAMGFVLREGRNDRGQNRIEVVDPGHELPTPQ